MTDTDAARRPHAEESLPESPWPALWSLVIGFFMILVDSTIVSVATPALGRAFHADLDSVLWVTSAYLLAYAVPLLITGRLGDRVGPKNVYLAGLTLFTLASLWCGLTVSIGMLVLARVVQGLGASMMTPQTMSVITRTFPPERRGGAMAVWGATAGVATLVGPILGGLLIDGPGWEWVFFINVPVGVVGFVLAARFVPRLATHAHSFDWLGVALSAVGLFCGTFALQEGRTFDWGHIWGPFSVPLLLGVGAALLIVFVWWQWRIPREPLVPLSLFGDRNFTVANLAIATVGFAITAMMFPFFIYAQVVRGLTPTMAALLLAPQAFVTIVLARPVGRLVDRTHPRVLGGVGVLGMAVSIFLLAWLMTPTSPTWAILLVAAFFGVANSFVWGPLSTSANRNLPRHLAGAGSGVYNTTRTVGSVIGSAAMAALLVSRMAANLPAGHGRPSMGSEVAAIGPLPPFLLEPFSRALAEAMVLPGLVAIVGWLTVLFFEAPHHLRAPEPSASDGESGPAVAPQP